MTYLSTYLTIEFVIFCFLIYGVGFFTGYFLRKLIPMKNLVMGSIAITWLILVIASFIMQRDIPWIFDWVAGMAVLYWLWVWTEKGTELVNLIKSIWKK